MGSIVKVNIKAVPGARRDEVVGWLGDRLKIRISAPPEDGRANLAIRELLARELGVRPADVAITAGLTRPEKTVEISGITDASIWARWPRGSSGGDRCQ